MRRIESVHVPSETRRMLRERLTRFLPVNSTPRSFELVNPTVTDQEIVCLLSNLEFLPGNDIEHARLIYEEAAKTQASTWIEPPTQEIVIKPDPEIVNEHATSKGNTSGALATNARSMQFTVSVQVTKDIPMFEGLYPPPSFNELFELGWIRQTWGRIWVPDSLRRESRHHPQAAGTAFKLLVEEQNQHKFKFRDGFSPEGELLKIANGIITEELRLTDVACISRPWIAARLWGPPFSSSTTSCEVEAQQRLSRWIDSWQLLNYPSFQMSSYLDPDSFSEFVEISLAVLTKDTTTPGWIEFIEAARAPITLLYPHRLADSESIISSVPVTTVEQVEWMSRGLAEETFHEYIQTRGSSLFSVLLNEIQNSTFDPKCLASRLMKFIVKRPVLLQQLVISVRQAPVLFADMLMVPETCPLACSLIACWEFDSSGWNRNFQIQANDTTAMLAFEDAIGLLGCHIHAEQVSAAELAALYRNIFELSSNPHKRSRCFAMLSLLRQELASASSEIQDKVFSKLVLSASAGNNKMTGFCAALDLISEGWGVDRIDPSEIVSLYLDELLMQTERNELTQLGLPAARSFVFLALRCKEPLRSRFLKAINVRAWMQALPTAPDEQHAVHRLLAQRIRIHIRLLSRAIAGWPTEVPEELVDALSNAIHAGATDQAQRGRIDAFVPGPGFGLFREDEEQPIALDLAGALRRLQGVSLQKLVIELCQIDEPLVLAGIISNTPIALHEQIKNHLETITPENAPEVWNWPALQSRVDALLNAELPEVAEVFIAAEREASTWGPVRGREIATLRATLRMLLLRQDWPAIASYSLPNDLSESLRREGNDLVLFYRGVAELKKPDGNPAAAEIMFLDLHERNKGVTSYSVNLFASRVSRLLSSDSFGLLSGDAHTLAKRYLADVQQEIRPLIQHSTADVRILDINRAILLLAVGQPWESLQILMGLTDANYEPSIEGFRALSMARLGRKREALVILSQAENAFGCSDLFSAVRENIDTYRPFATVTNILIDDDPVPGIRHAFEAFSRLGANEQAQVLQSHGRIDYYLIEQVRAACSSIVALAPMMRELGMVRHEDDISGVLKQILRSRLVITQWAVEDQSRGGFSQSGGVGERDLVISKGSSTLAVIEALITETVERVNLNSHFNKLLGYDTCKFFFHITYARRSNCDAILAHLRTACASPPFGFNHISNENLEDFDSSPMGFKAYYRLDSRDIIVVFLALEIGQPIQRAAAAKAK